MTGLTLFAPDRSVQSELKTLSGQLEAQKYFATHVELCATDRRPEDVAATLRSRMNGSATALFAVLGRDADLAVNNLEHLSATIPVVLIVDSEGYSLLQTAAPQALKRDIIFVVYIGNADRFPETVSLGGKRPRGLRVSNELPWQHNSLYRYVAEDIVSAIRRRPFTDGHVSVPVAVGPPPLMP